MMVKRAYLRGMPSMCAPIPGEQGRVAVHTALQCCACGLAVMHARRRVGRLGGRRSGSGALGRERGCLARPDLVRRVSPRSLPPPSRAGLPSEYASAGYKPSTYCILSSENATILELRDFEW